MKTSTAKGSVVRMRATQGEALPRRGGEASHRGPVPRLQRAPGSGLGLQGPPGARPASQPAGRARQWMAGRRRGSRSGARCAPCRRRTRRAPRARRPRPPGASMQGVVATAARRRRACAAEHATPSPAPTDCGGRPPPPGGMCVGTPCTKEIRTRTPTPDWPSAGNLLGECRQHTLDRSRAELALVWRNGRGPEGDLRHHGRAPSGCAIH